MAMSSSSPDPMSAIEVAHSFVNQYYKVLQDSPEHLHKFYQDYSVLGRPGINGSITSVTTLKDIDEKIKSLDYKNVHVDVVSVNAQDSLAKGVIVVVTGYFTGKDHTARCFCQSFFLAHAGENAYFVLNDLFRFMNVHKNPTFTTSNNAKQTDCSDPANVSEEKLQNRPPTPAKVVPKSSPMIPVSEAQKDVLLPTPTKKNPVVIANGNNNLVVEKSNLSKLPVIAGQKDSLPAPANGNIQNFDLPKISISPIQKNVLPPPPKSNGQKISYASLVARDSNTSSPVRKPACTIVKVSATANHHSDTIPAAPKKPDSPEKEVQSPAPQTNNAPKLTGIYIGKLPCDITKHRLVAVLKRFGAIRPQGIQIKHYENGGCCGRLKYELAASAAAAVEAKNVMFGETEAFLVYNRPRSSNRQVNDSSSDRGSSRGENGQGKGQEHKGEPQSNGKNYYADENWRRGDANAKANRRNNRKEIV